MSNRNCLLTKLRAGLLIAGTTALAACTATGDMFPMNDAAKKLGPVSATYVKEGTCSGPVTITMADGEVLKGTYRVAFRGGESFGSSTFAGAAATSGFGGQTVSAISGASTSSALLITGGNVQFVARGPKTEMLCRGNSGVFGHGSGQCQNDDGALWAIDW